MNKLNFNDTKTFFHGDLNDANIIVDPTTLQITGVIDWEFGGYGFEDGFFNFLDMWYSDKPTMKEYAVNWLSAQFSKENNHELIFFSDLKGTKIRQYLYELIDKADNLIFNGPVYFRVKNSNYNISLKEHFDINIEEINNILENWNEMKNSLINLV